MREEEPIFKGQQVRHKPESGVWGWVVFWGNVTRYMDNTTKVYFRRNEGKRKRNCQARHS